MQLAIAKFGEPWTLGPSDPLEDNAEYELRVCRPKTSPALKRFELCPPTSFGLPRGDTLDVTVCSTFADVLRMVTCWWNDNRSTHTVYDHRISPKTHVFVCTAHWDPRPTADARTTRELMKYVASGPIHPYYPEDEFRAAPLVAFEWETGESCLLVRMY